MSKQKCTVIPQSHVELDAERIGRWIYEATGMTNPELTAHLKALKVGES